MKNIINKIGNLKNSQSFFQINTIKGFKYIHKAGEIINYYHNGDEPPIYQMNPNGLLIYTPKVKIDTLRVTSEAICAKFSDVDSLDSISDIFVKESEEIIKILEIKTFARIGWRNNFIYEVGDRTNLSKVYEYLNKYSTDENLKVSDIKFEIETKTDFKAVLIVKAVIKNDNNTVGLLFDIDTYKTEAMNKYI
ncbi:MAG: hypothetical protein LBS61_05875 [Endomicrobium sp.]|jgi:hypothetical protein|nr:hypothetical protein [Endomicrobium sp.]